VDGQRLIDFASGVAVTSVGARNPAVIRRARNQLEKFTHTGFFVTPYESYVEVAEHLNRLTPGVHEKRSALFNSGAEAVENAVKVARAATGRRAVVAFDHAFHGRTNLTMALTAKRLPYKGGFGPFAGEIYRSDMAYPYRHPGTPGECRDDALDSLISMITTQVGVDDTAAVILEPIQGEGGFIVPPPGFVRGVSDWCSENGIVFIADEIQTGFCRTGDWFATHHENVIPDIVVMGKGFAGGLPLSAITGRADLMEAIGPGGLGGTYAGNPVACEAALGALEFMEEHALAERARAIETILREKLAEIADRHDVIGEIRGRGAMIAVELVSDRVTKAADPARVRRIQRWCHAQGLLVLTAGTLDNVIRFLPPLVISDELLAEGLEILSAAFDATA
jgi:4-aminobutyrate aminotransferase/(S)-3-amino-2-methylpropionate transaminase